MYPPRLRSIQFAMVCVGSVNFMHKQQLDKRTSRSWLDESSKRKKKNYMRWNLTWEFQGGRGRGRVKYLIQFSNQFFSALSISNFFKDWFCYDCNCIFFHEKALKGFDSLSAVVVIQA